MQKLVSILVVLALVFTLSLGAFADPNAQHTITIPNPDAAETHEYTAYQVFAGDYDASTTALSNVSWGSGVNGLALLEALRAELPDFAACETAAQVVQVLTGYASNSEEIRAFAAVVDRFTTTPAGVASADAEHPAEINVTGDGYYYVKDTSASLQQDTYSDYILLVEGDVTVEAKDTTGVTSQKKVKDINDSTLVGSDWQDSADYDIGDPVPFQFTGTVASDYDNYKSYKLVFHDVESEGLTFEAVTKVCVDGVEIQSGWTVVTDPEDGCTFEVVFENLKTIEAVKGGSVVTVEYISILNEDAVIGEPGNPNEMRMEYSNNPTNESSTGFTPWDKVVVFTYEVIVDKVDENKEPLPGAEFELWKWIPNDGEAPVEPDPYQLDEEGNLIVETPNGHWELVPGEKNGETTTGGDGKIVKINGKIVTEYTDPTNGELYYMIIDTPDATQIPSGPLYLKAADIEDISAAVANGSTRGVDMYTLDSNGHPVLNDGNYSYRVRTIERESTAGTEFTWKGVDDGHYIIIETETPAGYNTLDPIEFDVVAEHEEESEDPVLISVDGDPFLPTEENMGILQAELVNHSGGVLPSTGGIGTTLFYVLGGMLVLGAGILLVVKKFSDAK
jgi:fimbrial isopeptide formation D2 family protein/LPXTG-motif cell wall-anchored protein